MATHAMESRMLPQDAQLSIEHYYARKHLDNYVREAINALPHIMELKAKALELLLQWLAEDHYEAKKERLNQLDVTSFPELIEDILVETAYCQAPQMFVSVTAQIAERLGFDNKADSIKTTAEIVAVLCDTDAYDLSKASKYASVMVQSNLPLPEELLDAAQRMQYMPPMVSEPVDIRNNFQSPYLSYNECQVLGRQNGHEGDLCLDVLNLQNQIPLRLAEDFLTTVPEVPSEPLANADQTLQWNTFVKVSRELYLLMFKHGNRFFIPNKVDKRGRLYSCGYHITPQGSPYKKAMVEFAEAEVVEGVPGVWPKND